MSVEGFVLMTTRDSVLELKNRIYSSITGQDQAGSDLQRNNLNGGLARNAAGLCSGAEHCREASEEAPGCRQEIQGPFRRLQFPSAPDGQGGEGPRKSFLYFNDDVQLT